MHLVSILSILLIVSTHGYIPSDMMDMINSKKPACTDFYKYSCGGWFEKNKMTSEDTHLVSSIKALETRRNQIIQEIIEMKVPIVYEYWTSCIDINTLNQLGPIPLKADLMRLQKAETVTELMILAGEFARTGGSSFIKYKVGPDPYNTKLYTLLFQPEMTLPHFKYYIHPEIKEKYKNYIYHLMKAADYNENDTLTNKKRKRIVESESIDPFYKSLSEIIMKIENQIAFFQTQYDSIVPIKIQDAMISWPHLFMDYTNGMKVFKYDHDKRIVSYNSPIKQDLIIWGSREYLDQITTMLKTLSLEELRVYIGFRMIHSRTLWLGRKFDGPWFNFFRNTLKGQRTHRSRHQICRDRLREHLPDLIGHHFYRKAFDEERKNTVVEMITYIRVAMYELISKATWLDETPKKEDAFLDLSLNTVDIPSSSSTRWKSEKKKARDKLNQITILIGKSEVPRSYPSPLSPDDYPWNMYTIMSHSFDQEMQKIGQARNPREWTVSPMAINAHYIPDRNTLVLPIGVLQPPLFHGKDVHPARNFGALGSIIGHELIHAFDVKGSLYDGEGNNYPWWNSENRDYKIRARCFVTQYSQMKIYGKNVNGTSTLHENIADNGGVSLAWNAYRKYMTMVNPDTNKVIGTQGDKMFFLSYAQSLCERFRDQKPPNIMDDVFAPRKARVNGVVMNNPNFASSFQCQRNSAMNSRKCVLW